MVPARTVAAGGAQISLWSGNILAERSGLSGSSSVSEGQIIDDNAGLIEGADAEAAGETRLVAGGGCPGEGRGAEAAGETRLAAEGVFPGEGRGVEAAGKIGLVRRSLG